MVFGRAIAVFAKDETVFKVVEQPRPTALVNLSSSNREASGHQHIHQAALGPELVSCALQVEQPV